MTSLSSLYQNHGVFRQPNAAITPMIYTPGLRWGLGLGLRLPTFICRNTLWGVTTGVSCMAKVELESEQAWQGWQHEQLKHTLGCSGLSVRTWMYVTAYGCFRKPSYISIHRIKTNDQFQNQSMRYHGTMCEFPMSALQHILCCVHCTPPCSIPKGASSWFWTTYKTQ